MDEFNEDDREEFELVRDLGPDEAAKRLTPGYEEWTRGLLEQPERMLASRERRPEGDKWLSDDQMHVDLLLEGFREFAVKGRSATSGSLSRSCNLGTSCWRTFQFRCT